MKKKAIVALSGGMDSATVLAEAISQEREIVECVGFYYGSTHNVFENAKADALAKQYEIPFRLISLATVMDGFKSNLLKSNDKPIPEGHYEADSMRQTVVPGRNLIFISILTGLAWSRDAAEIWLGIHAGDHFIYPDCRPDFFTAMRAAVEYGSDHKVTLQAPFLGVTKYEILQRGQKLGVPYNLTRTCYKPQETACGKCGSCQERLTAFRRLGVEDPIPYESRQLLLKGTS